MEREHSLLNASASDTWLNCTRAPRFAAQFEKKNSDYAEEGTLCHSIATDLIMYRLGMLVKRVYLTRLAEYKLHRLYDPEMNGYALAFAEYVLNIYYAAKKRGWADIWIETKVDYSHIAPEGFGHLDIAILSAGTIDIIDFKYGKGIPVSALANSQLSLYALGVIKAAELLSDEFKTLNLHIHQPRIDNISVYNTTVDDCVKWANQVVKKKAKLAFDGAGKFVPGKWCRFCAALPKCKAAASHHKNLVKHNFVMPYELSNDDIADILLLGQTLETWLTAVKDYAQSEAKKGVKFPGLKLVSGRANRKYKEGKEAAIKAALKKKGFKESQFTAVQLLGIGAMEKLLGVVEFGKVLGKFVEKPEGAPTLVPETDKREPIGKDRALKAFKNIKIK